MDSKLILVKCITLTYCESLYNNELKSTEVVLGAVDKLKLPEQVTSVDINRSTILGLRETLHSMIRDFSGEPFNHDTLLQQVRINCGDDLPTFEALESIARYKDFTREDLLKLTKQLRNDIKIFLDQMSIKDVINKAHREVFYSKKQIDWDKFINGVVGDLELYTNGLNKKQKGYLLNAISMADPKSIAEVLEKAKLDNEGVGGFRSGWQAVNRMLGDALSFRRGMFVLVGALTHNYKSGFTHDLFRHACLYNTPTPKDKTKKPAIIYFSSENRAEEDVIRMYVALKENETGVAVNVNTIDPVEASAYIAEKLQATGFHVEMLRIDGNCFTYTDLFNFVIEYESAGFEIQAIYFDYLALIDTTTGGHSMMGESTRALMQRVRTFMSARDILFVTPHQLSQEAMGLKRAGVANFVAEIACKNYWDGSKRIANEADLEVFLDIVQRDGKFYLAIHRGKHRTVKATPAKYRHFYLPFEEVGYVPDDINAEDRSLATLQNGSALGGINWSE